MDLRILERSPKVKVSSPKSPSSVLSPIKTSKSSSRTNSNLVSPKFGNGNLCHNPISPRTPKEMTGFAIEHATGIIYPYNTWGPCNPTKYGHLANVPPFFSQKEHFKGKHDKVEKDRLINRRFGHIRHHCYYKNLIEPTTIESLSWQDPKKKEFWQTDVERVLKQDEEKRRAHQKELLGISQNKEAWKRHNAQKMRDTEYQTYLDLSENMKKYSCRNNISGTPNINIITRAPIGEYNVQMVNFQDDIIKYKRLQRTLMLQERNGGARDYDIISWKKNPLGPELPPWPKKPPTPPTSLDTRMPLNTSKGAISFGRICGPYGIVNIP